MSKHRLIAINLPQFHPFKENDEWWGKGFTEWTNVTKAKPRFKGHYQPQIPSDLGFYDLRLPEARKMQAEMAKEYGIYGFCYYHYWFNGHRLMERPVNEILSSGEPDFPFMLCWANENWSRNWDGGFNQVLIEQKYSKEDDRTHMEYLCREVFSDKRYIRIDNKPFFVIYNPSLVPDLAETIKVWRSTAAEFGIQLYLGYMRDGLNINNSQLMSYDFDVHVDFQPKFTHTYPVDYFKGSLRWFFYRASNKISNVLVGKDLKRDEHLTDYCEYVDYSINKQQPVYYEFPCVSPGWDNSSRRVGKPFWAFVNNTPELFGKWLAHELSVFTPRSKEENFVFINAWNEWAEGNHLEPDQKWGRQFLIETKKIIDLDCE